MLQKSIALTGISVYLPLVLFVFVFLGNSPLRVYGQNEVYLSIQTGGSGLIGIGVDGFESAASGVTAQTTTTAVKSTIIDDLNTSGLFQVKTKADSLSTMTGGLFAQWKAAGARYYLFGGIKPGGSTVEVNLVDLQTALTILNEEYRISNDRPWTTAHVIVDDVIQQLTGLRGSMASQIAFVSPYRGDSNELYVMDADGRNKRQLTYTKQMNMSPNWSRDASSLVFSSMVNGVWTIKTIQVSTGRTQQVSNWGGLNSAPVFSPVQDNIIAFTSTRDGNSEIYTCSSDGRNVRRITSNPRIDSSPSWSPDGSRMTFTSDRISQPMIYIMNSDGSNPRRMTSRSNAYEDSPCWSPRGDRIAFVVLFDRDFDIATCSPDGDDTIILTAGEGSNENPRWSPDGLRILFTSTRDGGRNLYVMNADGTNVRRLTENGNSYSPAWAPSSSGNDIRISSRR
jgi:TolB protein